MYLRVTAFKSDPAEIEAGIAYLRDKIIPSLKHVSGFLGATCVVDRDKSTGAASTLWESLEAMNKAEQAGVQARIDSEAATGIEVMDVDRFEITTLEMATPTAKVPSYTRLITAYGDPKDLDKVTQLVREQSLPKLRQQPGFRAFAAGVNRMSGRGFTSASFASAEEREASNAALMATRERAAEAGHLYGLQIDLVETVIAEIKVPTTA
jgi:hypothetical protein